MKLRVQLCDSYLKERFLSFFCLFNYFFFAIRISRFFLLTFFVIRIFFPSAFFYPHFPISASAIRRYPVRALQTPQVCRLFMVVCLFVVVVVFCSFVFQLFVISVLCIHFLQHTLILHNLLKMPSIGKSALVFWNCEFSRIKQVKLIFVSFLDLLRL